MAEIEVWALTYPTRKGRIAYSAAIRRTREQVYEWWCDCKKADDPAKWKRGMSDLKKSDAYRVERVRIRVVEVDA